MVKLQLRAIIVSSLQIADGAVLLPLSALTSEMQLSFFSAGCEAAGKRVSTFKYGVMVLSLNKVACCVQMRGEQLYQVE